MSLDIRLVAHSWLSDWNHGNAHFLRGLAQALQRRGHRVRAYEGVDAGDGGWSLRHLRSEPRGRAAIAGMRRAFADLNLAIFATTPNAACPPWAAEHGCRWIKDWNGEWAGADVVMVHEWTLPEVGEALLAQRRRHGFRLLLYDTHHRAISQPEALQQFPLKKLDGVIAFGESLRRVYERYGARRTYTMHEAADIEHFRSESHGEIDTDVVWIGNWGDDERSRELETFLLSPARATRARLRVFGVRYPELALAKLRDAGAEYGGYLPNLDAPAAYGEARLTVHVPRQVYASGELRGIPTIRMFEALACGAALVSSPWRDDEGLFEAGEDYWVARDGNEAAELWRQLLGDDVQRKRLGQRGAAKVARRHTCNHRAIELEAICNDLD